VISIARDDRHAGLLLAGVRASCVLGWAAVAYIVMALEPEAPLNVVALLLAFTVASGATVSLIAYGLSFKLFSDRSFRGNVLVCALQGLAAGPALGLALALQVARAPSTAILVVGAAAFVGGQAVVLVRARRQR